MLLKHSKLRKSFALFLCAFTLSGCLDDISPFSQKTDYSIQGLDENAEVKEYLGKILNENLAEDIDFDEGSDDFLRAEKTREELIVADLKKALRAKGYYDSDVEYVDDEGQPLKGEYIVDQGALYTIGSITVVPKDEFDNFDFETINAGEPLEAQKVLDAQNVLFENVQADNCYFSLDVTHKVFLNETEKTASIEFEVARGPKATFGPAIFTGHESVKDSYLRKMVTWEEGGCFRQEKIRALRTKLLESGLFVRADSVLPDAPDENGEVPVTIELKERVHRSVKAGASYYTDEGAGITLGWEHRNFLGAGEKLDAELKLNQLNQSLDVNFTKPFFLKKNQSLLANAAIRQQDTDAFEETAFDIGASVKRQINKRLALNVGTQFTFSEITDEDDTETYGLLSFPVSVVFDNRDNQLDPHKGWYLNASAEPFYDMLGESDPFFKLEAGARTYFHFLEDPDLVLALRGNVGSLVGNDTAEIPATERFFAGGGGSIRGFGYQQVGPFEDGDPTGGRSVITSSSELRMKFTETLGGVAFVDMGSVSESTTPDFDNLSFGAGVGVRYFTGFGPLRFDVAVPLNQKEDLDQNYQFYISIGQAF